MEGRCWERENEREWEREVITIDIKELIQRNVTLSKYIW